MEHHKVKSNKGFNEEQKQQPWPEYMETDLAKLPLPLKEILLKINIQTKVKKLKKYLEDTFETIGHFRNIFAYIKIESVFDEESQDEKHDKL